MIPEEDKKRIEEAYPISGSVANKGINTVLRQVANLECEYWQSKLKALQGISDGKSQVIKDLEAKLKERDELFVKDLNQLREKLIGECQPWVFCCTSIDNGIKELLTKYGLANTK